MSTQTLQAETTDIFVQEVMNGDAVQSSRLPALNPVRNRAAEYFLATGIPTIKHEEWKYTNLKRLKDINLRPVAADEAHILDRDSVNTEALSAKVRIVIENGRINKNASDLALIGEGVKVGSFEELSSDSRIREHLAMHASYANESMVAMNTALFYDGVAILVEDKVQVPYTIHVVFAVTATSPVAVQNRILVVCGNSSMCSIIEEHISTQAVEHFTNVVCETVNAANSNLVYTRLQDMNDKSLQVNFHQAVMERDSMFDVTTLTLNGSLVRNNLHILMNGRNCSSHLNGLYVVNGTQLVDNHTLVDHAQPDCYSNELYKGIIDDAGHGVFNGKVFVRQDAQKTNAYQSNKNILLSNDAVMNAKPQLEIYADDVKCSHGATTGQIDDEALFYLRSRGIGEVTARALINHAFAADVIERIKDESLREELLERLDRKLQK